MPKTKISEFSATANSNTDINSINIAEGCAPSNINDAIRELMAELKDFQAGTKGDSFNGPVGTTTAAAGAFTTLSSTGNTTLGDASGDTVTINGTTTFVNVNPTLSAGTANGVLYLNGSKVATSGSALTFDGTTLKASLGSSGATAVSNGNTLVLENSAAVGMSLLTPDANASRIYFGTASNNRNAFIYSDYNSGAQTLIFGLGSGATAAIEQMRLTSTGLGIGTSSPAVKLHVSGQSRVADSSNASNYMTFGVGANAPYGNASISTTTAGLSIVAEGNGNMTFLNNGAERMRIDPSGNLGLGVTPSAWGSGTRGLDIGSGSAIWNPGSGNQTHILTNAYTNNTDYIYKNSSTASRYAMVGNSHQWFVAPSGTAGNAITFTQAMTLDASGRLGIGTTAPNTTLEVAGTIRASRSGSSGTYMEIFGGSGAADPYINVPSGFGIPFLVNGSEKARIDSSGNLLVNTTGTSNGALINWYKASGTIETSSGGITTAQNHIVFANPNGNVGSIQVDGSATSYNTSSDYRLKNTITPMTGALAKVALLKPVTYKWNADGSDGEGFIAHELAEVVPQCVTGEKDAVETYTDEEGNEQTRPVYQGIDTSFLVATLTAAIQELKAEFDAYKATHP